MCKIKKKAISHTLLYIIATYLFDNETDTRIIQEFLGHKHIFITQIYMHVPKQTLNDVESPIENLKL